MDLHAITHQALDAESCWQGFQFLPHGLLWHIQKCRFTPTEYRQWQVHSSSANANVGQLIQEHPQSHVMFPGSWEEAAFHISVDALYQRALFELSYAIKVAGKCGIVGEEDAGNSVH